MKFATKLWIGLGVLTALSPLGLIIPGYFKSGSAWGEWGTDEIQKIAGYIPRGLEKLSGLWKAPMPDYAFRGAQENGLLRSGFAYIISAVAGVIIIILAVLLIGRLLAKKGE
jgi:cobalt/nickel transport protein